MCMLLLQEIKIKISRSFKLNQMLEDILEVLAYLSFYILSFLAHPVSSEVNISEPGPLQYEKIKDNQINYLDHSYYYTSI